MSQIAAGGPSTDFCNAGRPLGPAPCPAGPIRARTVRSGNPKSAPLASGPYIPRRNIRQVCEIKVLTYVPIRYIPYGYIEGRHEYGP